MRNAIFLLAFSLLNAHELDAMVQQEWRILIGLRALAPSTAESLFVILHIPLVAVLLWLAFHRSAAVAAWTRRAICAFGPVHVVLHALLRDHPAYSFDSPLSQALIAGYGIAGAAYLLVDGVWMSRQRRAR